MNRRIVQTAIGSIEEALEIVRETAPEPGPDEVLVELVLAPINPAEVLMLAGAYGYGDSRPALPRPAGVEGVGRVIGGATDRIPEGSLVALAGTPGVLSDYRVIPVDQALVLPDGADVEQVAVGFINAQCAILNLGHPALAEGGWLIQNAANSGYGRVVDALAQRRGTQVVNVVRSERAAQEIEGQVHGPILVDGPDLAQEVLRVTDGQPPRLALDAVGGRATGSLAAALAPGGTVLTYGLLSGDDCQVDTRLVVFHGIRLEGFWFPRARAALDAQQAAELRSEAMELVIGGLPRVPVADHYPLDDIVRAFEHAARESRGGKILIHR